MYRERLADKFKLFKSLLSFYIYFHITKALFSFNQFFIYIFSLIFLYFLHFKRGKNTKQQVVETLIWVDKLKIILNV